MLFWHQPGERYCYSLVQRHGTSMSVWLRDLVVRHRISFVWKAAADSHMPHGEKHESLLLLEQLFLMIVCHWSRGHPEHTCSVLIDNYIDLGQNLSGWEKGLLMISACGSECTHGWQDGAVVRFVLLSPANEFCASWGDALWFSVGHNVWNDHSFRHHVVHAFISRLTAGKKLLLEKSLDDNGDIVRDMSWVASFLLITTGLLQQKQKVFVTINLN
jgi:hypothetical protein